VKPSTIPQALAVLAVCGQHAFAGSFPIDVPALGYSAQNMDRTVSPREDFYHYAAGNWLKKNRDSRH
jgi:hypothetical protein